MQPTVRRVIPIIWNGLVQGGLWRGDTRRIASESFVGVTSIPFCCPFAVLIPQEGRRKETKYNHGDEDTNLVVYSVLNGIVKRW